jgi:hypothetical protein
MSDPWYKSWKLATFQLHRCRHNRTKMPTKFVADGNSTRVETSLEIRTPGRNESEWGKRPRACAREIIRRRRTIHDPDPPPNPPNSHPRGNPDRSQATRWASDSPTNQPTNTDNRQTIARRGRAESRQWEAFRTGIWSAPTTPASASIDSSGGARRPAGGDADRLRHEGGGRGKRRRLIHFLVLVPY